MDIKIVIEQFFNYATFTKGYSSETLRRFKSVLALYCRLFSITTTQDISLENVRNLFFQGRSNRNWSTHTYHVYHKTLKVFFRWCQQQSYIISNPIEEIECPPIEKQLPKAITKQEAIRLLDVIDNYPYIEQYLRYRNHAIFATFIYCGLRKSEVRKLRYTDVDLENLTLFVRQGKGAKDRILPICASLAEILKRYLVERRKRGYTCPEFFVSSNGNWGLSDNGFKLMLLGLRKALGYKIRFHQLRHTFATLMLVGGCDLYSLSKMMGHSQIITTTIYLSASIEHLRSQIDKHPLQDPILWDRNLK